MLELKKAARRQRGMIRLHCRYSAHAAIIERLEFHELRDNHVPTGRMMEPRPFVCEGLALLLEFHGREVDEVDLFRPGAISRCKGNLRFKSHPLIGWT